MTRRQSIFSILAACFAGLLPGASPKERLLEVLTSEFRRMSLNLGSSHRAWVSVYAVIKSDPEITVEGGNQPDDGIVMRSLVAAGAIPTPRPGHKFARPTVTVEPEDKGWSKRDVYYRAQEVPA